MPTVSGTPTTAIQNTGVSLTFSFTMPATGARRAVTVYAGAFNSGGGTITGVTYGGVAMTKVGATRGNITSEGLAEQWVLVNPLTGANNVVITGSASFQEIWGAAAGWVDVHQTTPTVDEDGATGSSATVTIPAMTVAGSNVGVGGCGFFVSGVGVPTPSDTLLVKRDASSADTGCAYQHGDGTLSWTLSASGGWAAVGLVLQHDGGGAVAGKPAHYYQQQRAR